jgi:hypothetical protein
MGAPEASAQSAPAEPSIPRTVWRRRRRRDWSVLTFSILLLAAAVLPPLGNIGRYQRRIASTISTSLGRPVHMRSVSLRMLPMPGIVMSDFEIEEDPAFGAEPSLRSPSVVAQLRMASLWRGQLEVGRIDLDEASVNLVRDAAGHWNVGAILNKASTLQNAPSAQPHSGAAPRFPYISATDARINFKQGAEKTPFSLLNADISMWLSDPDDWQIRIEAQPARTDLDLDLADTGLLRIEGRLHRASALGRMPLAIKADWSHAPLGQMSRLVLGRDAGWRGDLHASAELSGNPDQLELSTRFEVANMRRQDYSPVESLDADTTCHAAYSRVAQTVDHIACRWPVGAGELLLSGSASLVGGASPALRLEAHKLPAAFGLAALRLVRDSAAPSVTVAGAIDGGLNLGTPPATATDSLDSISLRDFRIESEGGGSLSAPLLEWTQPPTGGALVLAPTPVTPQGGLPLILSSRLGPDTFLLHWTGTIGTAQLDAWSGAVTGRADLFPITAAVAAQGTADLDLTIEGPILGNVAATVAQGTLRLRNARYAPPFLPEPVQIPLAVVTFAPGSLNWSAPTVLFHKLPFAVSAQVPLGCADPEPCVTHFDLTTPRLDAAQTQAMLLGTGDRGELLNKLLAKLDLRATHWPALSGSLHAGTLTVGPLAIRDALAQVSIEGSTLRVSSLSGRGLGGALLTTGSLDVISGTPHYQLDSSVTGASASAAGQLFGESWGPGTLNLATRLDLSGYTAEQLTASAKGTLLADWSRGALPGNTALGRFDEWRLDAGVAGQKLSLATSVLTPAGGSGRKPAVSVPVTGSIGFDRSLDLKIANVPVAGTIAQPHSP